MDWKESFLHQLIGGFFGIIIGVCLGLTLMLHAKNGEGVPVVVRLRMPEAIWEPVGVVEKTHNFGDSLVVKFVDDPDRVNQLGTKVYHPEEIRIIYLKHSPVIPLHVREEWEAEHKN